MATNEKAKKKPFSAIAKFFRETKAEFKKVIWPTKKQLINNSIVVIVTIIAAGIFVCALDVVFDWIVKLVLL